MYVPFFKREQGVGWDQVRVGYGCRVGEGSGNSVDQLNYIDRFVSTSSSRSQREKYVARFGAKTTSELARRETNSESCRYPNSVVSITPLGNPTAMVEQSQRAMVGDSGVHQPSIYERVGVHSEAPCCPHCRITPTPTCACVGHSPITHSVTWLQPSAFIDSILPLTKSPH